MREKARARFYFFAHVICFFFSFLPRERAREKSKEKKKKKKKKSFLLMMRFYVFMYLSFMLCLSYYSEIEVYRYACVFMCVMMCVERHVRIAICLVTDSRCRGGIVNIRSVFSCARIVQRHCPTALWQFRARTSNIPSDHTWLHTYTPNYRIYHIYAQKGIRVHEDDLWKLPTRQYSNSKAL